MLKSCMQLFFTCFSVFSTIQNRRQRHFLQFLWSTKPCRPAAPAPRQLLLGLDRPRPRPSPCLSFAAPLSSQPRLRRLLTAPRTRLRAHKHAHYACVCTHERLKKEVAERISSISGYPSSPRARSCVCRCVPIVSRGQQVWPVVLAKAVAAAGTVTGRS